MDTHYLNYILTIAEKRNMTKAAQVLFVSQSSLSQYLSKLEQELGTPLFLRTKGELVPTAAGELYIKAAKQILSIKKQLYKDISSLENRGSITIGTTSQFGLGIMAKTIPMFRAEYPDFTIEITEAPNQDLTRLLLDEQTALFPIKILKKFFLKITLSWQNPAPQSVPLRKKYSMSAASAHLQAVRQIIFRRPSRWLHLAQELLL